MSDAAALRLKEVKENIGKAEKDAERPNGSVTLIAVSKTFEASAIKPVLEAGQRVFGENRVQEAMGKWPGLREEFEGVELHLLGTTLGLDPQDLAIKLPGLGLLGLKSFLPNSDDF